MDKEQARRLIRERISCAEFLEKSKDGFFCCPFCDSGNGKNQTGALWLYNETNTFYCHSCERWGDVIDLYRRRTGASFPEALQALASTAGVTIDPDSSTTHSHQEGKQMRTAETKGDDQWL